MSRLLSRPLGRCVGLDVHLDFCEIAICEEGKVWSAGRVPSTPEGLDTLAESLLPSDRVALEVTGSSWEIVKLLEPHVSKVVVVSPGAALAHRQEAAAARGQGRCPHPQRQAHRGVGQPRAGSGRRRRAGGDVA